MFQKQISAPVSVHQHIFLFFLMMFFVYMADAMMSYFSPIVLEKSLGSTSMMGYVMATSSLVGLTTDYIFARYFSHYKSFFFLRLMFLVAFFFPLSFLFGQTIFLLLMAMFAWGISYEAMMFSTYHTIHESVSKYQHAFAWGMIAIFRNVSLVIGPIVASATYDTSPNLALFTAVMMYCTGLIIFFIYLRKKNILRKKSILITNTHSRSFIKQLKIWWTYCKVLWPVLTFSMIMYLFDSAVFSIGPLLGEEMKDIHPFGGIFVSLYSIPGIFLGFILQSLTKPWGKKRVAFASGVVAGVSAVMMVLVQTPTWILIWMFLSSVCIAISHPAMSAVFEDLISRAGKTANDVISLSSMSIGVGYVLGPAANGVLAERFGNIFVFGIWGVLMSLSSILLLMYFPRKIKLPQSQIEDVLYD